MFQDSLLDPRPPWIANACHALAKFRFLTARQLAVAIGVPADRLAEGLPALVADRLLVRLGPAGSSAHDVVALSRAGLALVARTGDVPPRAVVPHRATHTLAHELVVNDLGLVVEQLHARGRLSLLDWRTERERLADVTHLNVKGRVVRVPLVADALVVLGAGTSRTALLVEVDMGTVSAARMRLKYAGYLAWWKDGGPARRLGLSSTRVLTIAATPRRLERLRALACEAAPPVGTGLFWFLPLSAVDPEAPERLLDPVAKVARLGDDTPHTLLSTATSTN